VSLHEARALVFHAAGRRFCEKMVKVIDVWI
jgi:hypothetical protein